MGRHRPPLVQAEIVLTPFARAYIKHLASGHGDLGLQGVPLLLAAVVRPLPFWGRSIGV
jgi:hypothetical protein